MINDKKLENKLKKTFPKVTLIDVKPVDPFDMVNKAVKCSNLSNSVKDLYILDVQALFCQILCSHMYNSWPRWCRLTKPQNISSIHLIVVDGLTSYTWSECLSKYRDSQSFNKYSELFLTKLDKLLRFVNPVSYGVTWKFEFFGIPINFMSSTFRLSNGNKSLKRKLRKAITLKAENIILLREKYNLNNKTENNVKENHIDKFPRTQLLMSIEQIKSENVPYKEGGSSRWNNFKYSIPSGYQTVSDSSAIYALDCEMVDCINPITKVITKELASVSLVDEKREVIYHTFVKPSNPIVNYLTSYSGITPEILNDTSTTLAMVQDHLATILPPDAILAGHSIFNDMEALQLFHPYLIDTAVIYNLKGLRGFKSKLKDISTIFLNREIQGKSGHDSVEDALATMDLVLLKLSRTIDFGDLTLFEDHDVTEGTVGGPEEDYDDVITDDAVHLRHKQLLNDSKQLGPPVNLLRSVLPSISNPYQANVVARINETIDMSISWFPDEYRQFVTQQKLDEKRATNKPLSDRKRKLHPFVISEVARCIEADQELPSEKWISEFLEKIVREFDSLPAHSLCAVIFTDGRYKKDIVESGFGNMFFGITCPSMVTRADLEDI